MSSEMQQSGTILLDGKSREKLAEIIAELLKSNSKVIMALYMTMCKYPYMVVQY